MKIITRGKPLIALQPKVSHRTSIVNPRSNRILLLTHEQLIGEISAIARGLDKLELYTQQKSRHVSREVEFSKAVYSTEFGLYTACWSLPESWYVGHCPGEPIVRIVGAANRPGFDPEDMFYVPELAGREDGDPPDKFAVFAEGIVPFNAKEAYRRFTRDAFPAFLRMVIAAVGFDPRDESYGDENPRAWAGQVEEMHRAEFAQVPERDRAALLKLLRKIWLVKYGTRKSQHPEFLKAQLEESVSRLREMGWLMTKIERDGHQYTEHHYWSHCKGLLKDITGRDAAALAYEYSGITLAEETEMLLKDKKVGHILFYKPSREARAMKKVCVFLL